MHSEIDPSRGTDKFDNGIRSSELGSFAPEGTYRAIPIVWLAAAWILQGVILSVLFMVLSGKMPVFIVLTCLMVTIGIAKWTFSRGMSDSATGWKIATVTVLLFNWVLVSLAAYQ